MKLKRTCFIEILKIILFFLLLMSCTFYVERTLKDKENYLKYSLFYEEKESFDVLFFGSSRMLNGIYPMELWDQYKIRAYNMAQHAENSQITYWQMKNAFEHNVPRVAVVDVSFCLDWRLDESGDENAKGYLHKSLDHMPLSYVKYQAVQDLTENIDISEYLFPIAIYHNRWNDLVRNDFCLYPSRQCGAERRIAVNALERTEWYSEELQEQFDPGSYKLDAIVELCREKNVDLIFTCMPSIATSGLESNCRNINSIASYAEEEGVPFLNFAKEDEMINYATDFYDISHLNPSGAKKVTQCLGGFLQNNYSFNAISQEVTKEIWEARSSDYADVKKTGRDNAVRGNSPLVYFMLLNEDDYCYDIKMANEECIEAFGLQEIIKELGIDKATVQYGLKDARIEVTLYNPETMEVLEVARFY